MDGQIDGEIDDMHTGTVVLLNGVYILSLLLLLLLDSHANAHACTHSNY